MTVIEGLFYVVVTVAGATFLMWRMRRETDRIVADRERSDSK
jgi:hypothetical protein